MRALLGSGIKDWKFQIRTAIIILAVGYMIFLVLSSGCLLSESKYREYYIDINDIEHLSTGFNPHRVEHIGYLDFKCAYGALGSKTYYIYQDDSDLKISYRKLKSYLREYDNSCQHCLIKVKTGMNITAFNYSSGDNILG